MLNQIVNRDGVEGMKSLLENGIDLIVTDTPYWGMHEEFIDDNIKSFSDFLTWYENWIREAHRVLKPSGSLYVFVPPLQFAEIHLVIKKYFTEKQIISWVKLNVRIRQPTARNYLPKVEFVSFYVVDPKNYTWNKLAKRYGIQRACNFDIQPSIYGRMSEGVEHATQKPLSVVGRLIYASSNLGDVVLDPFCGSGTTCVAAKALGRRYIGFDIDPKSCILSKTRLEVITLEEALAGKERREDAFF